ncbi:STAS domain-containing protein [Couchioplanes caeruleus]|uniref:Anti-sigma factor antagonist n=2 Tax=Couchioplanes caeruleus TaxID=56438 RepID=A0A1K0G812_9ACTN|nr:STAS domain-containing protein [Couchioplanes caeruleus]OJF13386.1 anti-sigma factor [Couchioplanes caeruleus subsp. caeruleus]ROP29012.1 anti-anti-sigma factor [Couchioplanes caeruleus]
MARFEATTSTAPGRFVLALAGECDLEGRDRLSELLLGAIDRADLVVVDLEAVTFVDSSGIHALVTAHHAAKRAGGRLHVVNARGPVATVLEITGVAQLLAPPETGPREADHG